jgi:hypothetical protein
LSGIIPLQSSLIQLAEKPFKTLFSSNKYTFNGDCSLMVECGPVAPETGVRFTPIASELFKNNSGQDLVKGQKVFSKNNSFGVEI